MAKSRDSVEARARQYAARYERTIQDELGFGYDGIVFSTSRQSATKALRYEALCQRERDVYFRLTDEKVLYVCGCRVPKLWHWDDELWVIEMEIVSPPFVLDFAGAYLDQEPDFPEEVMAEWRAEKKEQFGDRWGEVQSIMREFRKMGIYLADVKPGNILFRE
ncbi:MAG: hypothetical protein HY290_05480 [Planctomycetia bacterium]|nr:hypothetical protein [Planctomycetia bacterium]